VRKVHLLASLLEFASTLKSARFGIVTRASRPPDIVVGVEIAPFLLFLFGEQLHAIVAYKDGRCSA